MAGRFFGRIVGFGLCVGFIGAAIARGAEATFDDLTPGVYGNTLVDGEILFDNAVGVNGPQGFSIDDYSGNSSINSQPGYTSPNAIGFGYAPGNLGAGGAFQSFDFQLSPDDYGPSITANSVSITVFTFNPEPGGIITLDGLLNNAIVDSASFDVPGMPGSGDILTLSGTFNSFEVESSGSFNEGYSLAAFDTVIVSVPEPASMTVLLSLSGIGLLARRPRRVQILSPAGFSE